LDAAAHRQKPPTAFLRVAPPSLLPDEDDVKKSATLGRYQFRRDGAGWECREIIGKGTSRKRPYLAYLSRTAYLQLRNESASDHELERSLLDWADRKREEKWNGSVRFEPASRLEEQRG
jgi:hypothetical protein